MRASRRSTVMRAAAIATRPAVIVAPSKIAQMRQSAIPPVESGDPSGNARPAPPTATSVSTAASAPPGFPAGGGGRPGGKPAPGPPDSYRRPPRRAPPAGPAEQPQPQDASL